MKNRRAFIGIVLMMTFVIAALYHLYEAYSVPVLVYHTISVSDKEPLNTVTPDVFLGQMTFLKRHRYNVISPLEYVEGVRAGRWFPHNTVVLTFDDGYEDNFTAAYPILKRFGFPAVIFTPAGHVGRLGNLTWDQMQIMQNEGLVSIGSHMIGEEYLPGIPSSEWRKQIVESKRLLEDKLGSSVPLISYPTGGFNDDIRRIVEESGYRAAFTTNRGTRRRNNDIWALRRIRIKNSDGPIGMWVKLSGYYNLTRTIEKPF